MSEPSREQVNIFLNSIWRNISTEISDSRNIDLDSLNLIADRFAGLQSNDFYLHKNLIDTLVYVDQTDSILNRFLPDNKKAKKIGHNTFTSKNKKSTKNKNKIAVIYADGSIAENGSINAKMIRILCTALKSDNAVKAVVLRVNSPGGSAFESENIWRALSQLKAKKPLVVSMGDYAASGGYYMACMADKIVAEPTTITGSIGIFGLFPNMKGVNDKIGLTYDAVKTHKMGDAYTLNRAFNEDERELMQNNVNRGYELFVKRCANGRNKTIDEIKKIAEGRVWTGENALEIGLVDTLGGINTAIEIAAQLAKVPEFQTVKANFEKRKNRVSLINIQQKVADEILKTKLGDYYQLFDELNNIRLQDPIQAKLLYDFNNL
jgi:protease-4